MLPLIPVLSTTLLLSFQTTVVMETCLACLGFPVAVYPKEPPPSVWGLKGLGNGSLFSCSDVRSQPLCSCCVLHNSVFTATSQQKGSFPLHKTVYIWPLDAFFCQYLDFEVVENVTSKIADMCSAPVHWVDTGTVRWCFFIKATFFHWILTQPKQKL